MFTHTSIPNQGIPIDRWKDTGSNLAQSGSTTWHQSTIRRAKIMSQSTEWLKVWFDYWIIVCDFQRNSWNSKVSNSQIGIFAGVLTLLWHIPLGFSLLGGLSFFFNFLILFPTLNCIREKYSQGWSWHIVKLSVMSCIKLKVKPQADILSLFAFVQTRHFSKSIYMVLWRDLWLEPFSSGCRCTDICPVVMLLSFAEI